MFSIKWSGDGTPLVGRGRDEVGRLRVLHWRAMCVCVRAHTCAKLALYVNQLDVYGLLSLLENASSIVQSPKLRLKGSPWPHLLAPN